MLGAGGSEVVAILKMGKTCLSVFALVQCLLACKDLLY